MTNNAYVIYFSLFNLESLNLRNALLTHGAVGVLPLLDLNTDREDLHNDIAGHQAAEKGASVDAEAVVLSQAVHKRC